MDVHQEETMLKPRLGLNDCTKLITHQTLLPDVSGCIYVCRAYMNPRVVCVIKGQRYMTVQWTAVNISSDAG
jgi:hypothetical protein